MENTQNDNMEQATFRISVICPHCGDDQEWKGRDGTEYCGECTEEFVVIRPGGDTALKAASVIFDGGFLGLEEIAAVIREAFLHNAPVVAPATLEPESKNDVVAG